MLILGKFSDINNSQNYNIYNGAFRENSLTHLFPIYPFSNPEKIRKPYLFLFLRILLIVVLIVIQFLLIQSSVSNCLWLSLLFTAQKMKFSLKFCFSKCEQIRRKLWTCSHLLKKFLTESHIFVNCFAGSYKTCYLNLNPCIVSSL